jgi:hypothetical protein
MGQLIECWFNELIKCSVDDGKFPLIFPFFLQLKNDTFFITFRLGNYVIEMCETRLKFLFTHHIALTHIGIKWMSTSSISVISSDTSKDKHTWSILRKWANLWIFFLYLIDSKSMKPRYERSKCFWSLFAWIELGDLELFFF